MANALTGAAFPIAALYSFAEMTHPVEYRVNLRNYVLVIYRDGCSSRGPQGHVQHWTFLGDIDLFSTEHGIDPRLESRFFRQLDE